MVQRGERRGKMVHTNTEKDKFSTLLPLCPNVRLMTSQSRARSISHAVVYGFRRVAASQQPSLGHANEGGHANHSISSPQRGTGSSQALADYNSRNLRPRRGGSSLEEALLSPPTSRLAGGRRLTQTLAELAASAGERGSPGKPFT